MRRGRWTRDPRVGWRLDGTNLVLDFDPLSGGDGCWMLSRDGESGEEAIDHYLDGAMEFVEFVERRHGMEAAG